MKESTLYLKLYFKKIFSIKNILFMVLFTWINFTLFINIIFITDSPSLLFPLIIFIVNTFAYSAIGIKKIHKKNEYYYLIIFGLFIAFNIFLTGILLLELMFANSINMIRFNADVSGLYLTNILQFDWFYIMYLVVLLGITTLLINSFVYGFIKNNKNIWMVATLLCLFVLVSQIACYCTTAYDTFAVLPEDDGLISLQTPGENTNFIYWFIFPWNSFQQSFKVSFNERVGTNINYFQTSNLWGFVWVSQIIWLWILGMMNVFVKTKSEDKLFEWK